MGRQRTNRSTIHTDPLDSIIPMPAIKSVEIVRTAAEPATRIEIEPSSIAANLDSAPSAVELSPGIASGRRQKLTVHLDEAIVNRVKNAAYWNPRLTIAKIAEQGIRHAIQKIEKENGGPYKQRESELVGGRPIK